MVFEIHRQKRPRFNNLTFEIKGYFLKDTKKNNKYYLHLQIGKEIAHKIGINENDFRIEFYIDSDNPRLWMIKPANDASLFTYKPSLFFSNYHLKLVWHRFVPSKRDMQKHIVDFKIQEDNSLIIDFDKKII